MIQKRLSLTVQLLNLRKYHPEGTGSVTGMPGRQSLVWRQGVRPDPLGAAYSIELRYKDGGVPEVLVRDPDLRLIAGGRRLPHIYDDVDGMVSLCLWKRGDWRQSRPVATTQIVWAAEWFWFFEYWLPTGVWLGGGTHETPVCPPTERSDFLPEIAASSSHDHAQP
jgi:hypothetical protein